MISVFGSFVGDEEIAAVSKVMKSQWMGFGSLVEEFETKYKKHFNLPSFAMVDSGSNALFMAVKLLDLPANSDIIVPSFTWVSCAQAVLMAGHRPVFCDVDLETMNVSADTVARAITDSTRAIMVVHYAGLPVDMAEILAFGLPVIEDAAHALDSTIDGAACGTIGDVGIFSFDAVKNLTVGEGGGITSRHQHLIDRAKILRYCGIGKSGFEAATQSAEGASRWWEYNITEPFIKMLPTNIAAAIGIEQLRRIDSLQKRRREIWGQYRQEFEVVGGIVSLPTEGDPSRIKHSYFTYCIRTNRRDELARFLLDNDVYTSLRYHPLHLNPLYGQTELKLKNSEELNQTGLSLPLHPRLSEADVQKVVATVKKFFATKS